MRKPSWNGHEIPYDRSLKELENMLSSSDMVDFCCACEALSENQSREAFELMKVYIYDKDKYRRLFILKTIFNNPYSVELIGELEKAILSEDIIFVDSALIVVYHKNIPVSEDVLISGVCRHFDKIDYAVLVLWILSINDKNYKLLTELYMKSTTATKQETIAEILFNKYSESFSHEIFKLLSISEYGKVRQLALRIGAKNRFDISSFENDRDGHVRKLYSKLV